ncbi:hypothetical protein MNBD_CPR01-362 [hydrothermal vent metagenome]|uniref:LTD domain-containing protein n=1 Tax=hydrothermal vent metagenome TaxID=652676 RepID=A0A3B0VKD0_9ZZZZ
MSDTFFIIGIFAFIFILWIGSGGPNRPLALSGPILHGTDSVFPKASGVFYKDVHLSNTIKKIKTTSAVKTLSDFETLSPYSGRITLGHYVSGADNINSSREYVTLRVTTNTTPIDITGWTLKSSASGVSAHIPKGTEVPRSGIVNQTQDIILRPGDDAIISSGRSPIGGSFRENICIGYFAQYQSFYPTLPLTCPIPFTELKDNYRNGGGNYMRDLACINYTRSLNRCSVVTTPPVNLSSSCAKFLTTYLNYNGCVNAHEHDSYFKNKTWRIYLNRDKSMWRTHYDSVELLDKNGKLVDMFSYQ